MLNVWNGGEYLNNTTGFFSSTHIDLTVSSDWSSKGDKSLLVAGVDDNGGDLVRLGAGTYESRTYILKMDIYNPSGEGFNVSFFNSSTNYQKVTIPQSDEVTHVELTLTPDTTGYLSIRISATSNTNFYCDNISIIPITTNL